MRVARRVDDGLVQGGLVEHEWCVKFALGVGEELGVCDDGGASAVGSATSLRQRLAAVKAPI